ncbi:MAG: SDR family oxidoreductase [Chloroflexota bacterium]
MISPKIALITGAGSGIGRAAAVALSGNGFRVVLNGRRLDPLKETAELCDDAGLISPADVSDPQAVDGMFQQIEKSYGRLDLLFNNAGIFAGGGPIDEIAVEDWLAAVNINLTGSFLCARAAFGLMRRQTPQGGRIINNGSISAYTPRLYSAPYTATKHAITGLTKSISLDGRQWHIACGQIDIGNAATELTTSIGQGALQADGSVREEPRMHVQDVAEAILYMAQLPLYANVQFMTVMATNMPYIGRG